MGGVAVLEFVTGAGAPPDAGFAGVRLTAT